MSHSTKGRAGGVLPVNAATRKNASAQSTPKSSSRTPAPRLRLVVRRLPPGLTETEFWTVLGDDWKVGAGRVDWAAFRDGKISRDPAKPSRPARAYIKVKEQSLLESLSTVVKQSSFQDAKNTTKDPCLLGPPSLEFAPYNKIPSGRGRNDGRQGTIDQDQEFIDFLQSLTEPVTKAAANGADVGDSKDKVSTTPLVQFIKEKKANKAKEASQARAAKARENKDAKTTKPETRSPVVIKGKAAPAAEKERVAKATEDAVKAINKSVAAMQSKQQTSAKGDAKQPAKETQPPVPNATPPKRERERGNASAAARMLQRDLGLVAKENKTQRTPKSSNATSNAETTSSSSPKPVAAPTAPKSDSTAEQKGSTASATTASAPTGPRASRTPSAASAKPSTTPSQRPAKSAPQPSTGAKSAFLKHANPSQGITEELLQTVFQEFGTILRCEIDKKKGLGYVDFSEAEGLKKAMAASPVKVGNGQVVVLENKSPYVKRGGGGGGGQGTEKQANAPSAKAAASASTQNESGKPLSPATNVPLKETTAPPTPTAPSALASTTPATTAPAGATPPTAPRGTPRGGGASGNRGGRGGGGGGTGSGGAARGGSRGGGQGAKQGQRGGRGGKRGGAGAAGNGNTASSADGGASPAPVPASAPTPAKAKEEAKKD
ncbi:Smg-4/UPF3 family-domain-containing protein [Exophiala viscosa]|uniref:Smg-4/UPF3 family-domain-containing protein n=1 Tax=Exophiala viscosa TaxID=2486360 RepID=UPI00219830E2|nr:Smg-4/UPF3 family-domain-containing protein [Exophiala viscosa]